MLNQEQPTHGENNAFNISCNFINYRLAKAKIKWKESSETNSTALVLTKLVRESERHNATELSELLKSFKFDFSTTYATFMQTVSHIFANGISWKRIVLYYAFCGLLAVNCAKQEMPEWIDDIVTWNALCTDTHLNPWIDKNGGWLFLISFVIERDRKCYSKSMIIIFILILLCVFLILGAMLYLLIYAKYYS